jgi:hypothetical protein
MGRGRIFFPAAHVAFWKGEAITVSRHSEQRKMVLFTESGVIRFDEIFLTITYNLVIHFQVLK